MATLLSKEEIDALLTDVSGGGVNENLHDNDD